MAFSCDSTAVNLMLLVLMKLINQLATFNYILFNANIYETVNGTCQFKTPEEVDKAPQHGVMMLFNYSYLAAAIGGLLSSACMNRRLVLTVGGCVMTAGSLAVAGVRGLGLACNRWVYILAWVPYPVFMCLIIACQLAAFADCGDGGRRPRTRTIALLMYYVAASSTIWFNLWVWPLANRYRSRQISYEFVAVGSAAFGLAFVAASRLLRPPQPPAAGVIAQFELPTMRRLLRYFLIFTALTLFIVQLNDDHIIKYNQEALHYMDRNSTGRLDRAILAAFNDWNVPRTVNIAGMLVTAGALAGLSAVRRAPELPPFQSRLLAGVGISAASAAWSLGCDLVMRALGGASGGVSPALAAGAFSAVAFAEGAAEILTMVAAYEFLDEMAPPGHKDLLFGIALSVWNTATIIRRGLYGGLVPLILPRSRDPNLSYCATHAIGFVLSVVCLAYTRFVSLPLASTILQTPDTDGSNSEGDRGAAGRNGEATPLLAAASLESSMAHT